MSQHQTPSVKGTDDQMTVRDLEIGETAQIDTVGGTGALRQHFLDMGPWSGHHTDQVRSDERPDGIHHQRL